MDLLQQQITLKLVKLKITITFQVSAQCTCCASSKTFYTEAIEEKKQTSGFKPSHLLRLAKDAKMQYDLGYFTLAFSVYVYARNALITVEEIWYFQPADGTASRKHMSGTLRELFLNSSNMIDQLKATVPTLSSENGEQTTCNAGLPVRQYLTASIQSLFSLAASYTGL